MKLRNSAKSIRSNVKLDSQDRANNNFNAELKKTGAIIQSDPYIRDTEDKTSAKSCFDQLYVTVCSCLRKNNQVRPANGYKRFEPHPTTSKRNGIMGNGATTGTKTTEKVSETEDKDKLTVHDMKHVEKFEYSAKKTDGPNNLNIYPAETGTFESTLNGVYRIPVKVETKESGANGTGMAGQSKYPNAKAKENIEKLFKSSDEHDVKKSHDYESESKGARSKQTKDPFNSTNSHEGDNSNWWKNDGTQNNSYSQSSYNFGSNAAYPTTNEAWGKYGPYGSNHKNNPDNFGTERTSLGTPHPKHSYQAGDSYKSYQGDRDATDFNTRDDPYAQSKQDRALNNEDRQFQTHHTYGESNKLDGHPGRQGYGTNYGDAPSQNYYNNRSEHDGYLGRDRRESKNPEEFSDSRDFVDNFRKKDETRKPGHSKNRDATNYDKGFESSVHNPGDVYSKVKTQKGVLDGNKKDYSERDSKFRGEKSEVSPSKHEKKDFSDRDSKSKGDKREKPRQHPADSRAQDGSHKNPTKSHQIGRNGRGKNDESFSDDEKNVKESRKFGSDPRKESEKNGLILNPAKLKHGERDDRFSKDGKPRKTGKGPLSADSGRRNATRANRQSDGLSKDATRGSKSVPNFDDEFTGSRAPQRIEPLGDSMQNEMANFSENRSNINNYPASTSVRNRTSHIPSMQQNDFMPLPTHIVNLPDDDMDFTSNDSVGIEKSLSTSAPHSKSYENLTHQNGFGDRFKHNSSQQRKLSEPKSSKNSPLYPNTLQPFDSPKDALEKCLLQIESPEWEIVMQSLQGIVRLSRHHPEVLVSALHRIVTGLSKQIRGLRSQVTKAACVVSQELFEHLGKIMDPEIEELAPALLLRTCDANKFLQHDANAALDSMIDSVTPLRSATFLLLKGAKHRNAVVRTTACRLLARLCQNLGVEQVYALPRDTRDSLLNAAAKFLLEGSLDTRAYAKELFSVLAREPKFMRLMNEVVPAKTMEAVRKPLVKIVSQK